MRPLLCIRAVFKQIQNIFLYATTLRTCYFLRPLGLAAQEISGDVCVTAHSCGRRRFSLV